ncbi:hypothetical protein PoB_007336200 [Plakobranchus ocellatus]|uniref:Uncharacterized protein n=1 Tax=Plakobranchus ocellatus TaxID=259542 RepID=A0AAV4DRC4_9GAST|nr:hypothetical protein PoB_007336200 [Plakobranchus ocellatus]
MYIASLQHHDLKFPSPPSGQGASGGVRIRDREVAADLRADSLSTVPPTPPTSEDSICLRIDKFFFTACIVHPAPLSAVNYCLML